MALTVGQNGAGLFSLSPEIRNMIYEFYTINIVVVLGAENSLNLDLAGNAQPRDNTQLSQEGVESTHVVVFDTTGHVGRSNSVSSRNLLALFNTCRQTAIEGHNILFNKALIRFRNRQEFVNEYNRLKNSHAFTNPSTNPQLGGHPFTQISRLSIMIESSLVFEHRYPPAQDIDARERNTEAMFHIMHTAMPSLKHLILRLDHTDRNLNLFPLAHFSRALFQLQGLRRFQVHYAGYNDHALFYKGGIDGLFAYGAARALEEIVQDHITALDQKKAGLEFPGGLLKCSEEEVVLTIGRAMEQKLDNIMLDIHLELPENEDAGLASPKGQEEFDYYFNIYRDIQVDLGFPNDDLDEDSSDEE